MSNKKPSMIESGLKLSGIATLSAVLSGCMITAGGVIRDGGYGHPNHGGHDRNYNTGWSEPRGGRGPVICGKFQFKSRNSSATKTMNTCAREGSYIFKIKNGQEKYRENKKCVRDCTTGRGRGFGIFRSDASDPTEAQNSQIAALKGDATSNDNSAIFKGISAQLDVKEDGQYALKAVDGQPVSEEESNKVNTPIQTLDAG